ncbi:Ig-like domain-containing protein [Fructilactobacillus hinvesii]|uniref:Ig-like domain-containing protein n=1 Tax=Fructilactobacillus hinvesii TaxID=2940300 RepID=A0ABY5BRL1_9LACO|nr:Ig-like domain-containing protein [Fructilactobacillus hinvesii]USS87758.1 Ig-like domain-containing protein [Fructilactobacillus hinvesii]
MKQFNKNIIRYSIVLSIPVMGLMQSPFLVYNVYASSNIQQNNSNSLSEIPTHRNESAIYVDPQTVNAGEGFSGFFQGKIDVKLFYKLDNNHQVATVKNGSFILNKIDQIKNGAGYTDALSFAIPGNTHPEINGDGGPGNFNNLLKDENYKFFAIAYRTDSSPDSNIITGGNWFPYSVNAQENGNFQLLNVFARWKQNGSMRWDKDDHSSLFSVNMKTYAYEVLDGDRSISGQGVPGSNISVTTSDGTVIGKTQVNTDGSYNLELSKTLNYNEIINVNGTDANGNALPISHVLVEFNKEMHKIKIDPLVSGDQTLSGTGTSGDKIIITDSNGVYLGSSTVDENGHYTVDINRPLNANEVITAMPQDQDGNVGDSINATVLPASQSQSASATNPDSQGGSTSASASEAASGSQGGDSTSTSASATNPDSQGSSTSTSASEAASGSQGGDSPSTSASATNPDSQGGSTSTSASEAASGSQGGDSPSTSASATNPDSQGGSTSTSASEAASGSQGGDSPSTSASATNPDSQGGSTSTSASEAASGSQGGDSPSTSASATNPDSQGGSTSTSASEAASGSQGGDSPSTSASATNPDSQGGSTSTSASEAASGSQGGDSPSTSTSATNPDSQGGSTSTSASEAASGSQGGDSPSTSASATNPDSQGGSTSTSASEAASGSQGGDSPSTSASATNPDSQGGSTSTSASEAASGSQGGDSPSTSASATNPAAKVKSIARGNSKLIFGLDTNLNGQSESKSNSSSINQKLPKTGYKTNNLFEIAGLLIINLLILFKFSKKTKK